MEKEIINKLLNDKKIIKEKMKEMEILYLNFFKDMSLPPMYEIWKGELRYIDYLIDFIEHEKIKKFYERGLNG